MADADVENIGDLILGMDFHTMSAGLDDPSRDLEPAYQAQESYAPAQHAGTQ
ncbi:hypothetical protein PCANC_26535 [Puccinia coronata f. sp. avenae]|uniref:Uncharacterized protein n=1 Tax=Puccinia coronata f. sp. avenae TaxID=200324 RepID=A0A2N5TZB2_9BASI|nr:hypothetical protein PCANC_26535 [Puccinia coronata f. sp. avenae]